jgi:starch synthase (maltosyl-transferring)
MPAFSRRRRICDRDDVLAAVGNLDPACTRGTWIHLTMPEPGFGWQDQFVAHGLITGQY